MVAQFRLSSAPMVYTPGVLKWAINGYKTPQDRKNVRAVIVAGWPSLPANVVDGLLTESIPFVVEGEDVVFEAEV